MFYSAGGLFGPRGEDNSGPKPQLSDTELHKQPRGLWSVPQALINASGELSLSTAQSEVPDPAQG